VTPAIFPTGLRARLRVALAGCLALLGLQAFPVDAGARAIFVTNDIPGTVVVIDSRTNTLVGSPIDLGAGTNPRGIVITPDGARAYVANSSTDSVSVIDTRTGQEVGPRIGVGETPTEIAITPDGKVAYVANEVSGVSAIDTRTNQVLASTSGSNPRGLAVAPDGRTLYVVFDEGVSLIDTRTNQEVSAIPLGAGAADAIAMAPDGNRAYVANGNGSVQVIDTRTNQVVDPPIQVGGRLAAIAVSPDGRATYVSNPGAGTVHVIDARTNQIVGPPIPVGGLPNGVVVTPDGKAVYVADEATNTVHVIDARTNQIVGAPIPVGGEPDHLAIVPNQPPVASFSHQVARPGVPVTFDAGASRDADGAIASFTWAFQGSPAFAAGPMLQRTFARPGTYDVTLTLADDEGCSTTLVFTGQTAHCNGSGVATKTMAVKVAYPGVRVRCPAKVDSRRCKFALQVVTKARKGKPKTRVAKAGAKRGKAAIVSLKPKARYAKQLARAKKVLVEVTLKTGDSQRTTYRKLKIVQ
jgi:YVTN family beta-propeller protein